MYFQVKDLEQVPTLHGITSNIFYLSAFEETAYLTLLIFRQTYIHTYIYNHMNGSRDSAASIAIGYGLDN
jgi:hypothetical protein